MRHFTLRRTLARVMETRHLVAYVLILLLAVFLVGVWRHLTRERRAHERTRRAIDKRKLDRLARDART